MFVKPVERVVKQQMAINGQVNEWEESVCELCCGKCGTPLMRAGATAADGYALIYHQKDQFTQQIQFCPHCGATLEFDMIIDLPASEITVINEEVVKNEEPK